MSDAADPPEKSEANADPSPEREGLRERAAAAERAGLGALETGDFDAATKLLLEAVAGYEQLGDNVNTNSTAHYLGVALDGQGESSRAVQIWEELVERGWDSPAAFNRLVRHYENRGDDVRVQRLYERLQQAAVLKTGQFFRVSLEPTGADGSVSPHDATPAESDQFRLLIADDEPATRAVLERILEPLGHDLMIATDGGEALRAMLAMPFDLIFLDIFMPIHSGLDILYRMRAEDIQSPVIIMSGVAHESMVRDAQALGAVYLAKPFDTETVTNLVTRILHPSRSGEDTPPAD